MEKEISNLVESIKLKGDNLSSHDRYKIYKPSPVDIKYPGDCDCYDGDCSDCHCIDCGREYQK